MFFDRFAGFVEKHHPELAQKAQEIHLFEFPYRAHEVVKPGTFIQEDLDDFILPFPAVAIEDGATCAILFDGEEKQFGCSGPRNFVEIQPTVSKDPSQFAHRNSQSYPDKETLAVLQREEITQIAFGTLHTMAVDFGADKYQVKAQILRVVILDKHQNILFDLSDSDFDLVPGSQEMLGGVVGNVLTAIEELLLAQKNRELFVLEKAPVKARPLKKGRVLRSHDRPRYIMLTPDAIRQAMGVSVKKEKGEGTGRTPHERRRHWRTLRSERFKHKQGQRILIDAHWVGPSEATKGNTRYKVRLDV